MMSPFSNAGSLRCTLIAALLASTVAATAGQKILFSGRDGRKAQYHRSLNARSLFEPQAVAGETPGESPADRIHSVPALSIRERKLKKGDDDKDWAFQSSDESGAERVEKEILGEEEDVDEAGIKRSRVERFLDRERERKNGDQGADGRKGANSRERRSQERDVELSKLQASLQGDPALARGGQAVGMDGVGSTTTSDAGTTAAAPVPSMGNGVMSPRSAMEFQRDHVSRLKQSLGVAAAPGVNPFGSSGATGGSQPTTGIGSGRKNSPLAGGGAPKAESIGAYPGSQGLGLMDLTTPAGAPQGVTPLMRPESNPQPKTRERSGPVRIRKSNRGIF